MVLHLAENSRRLYIFPRKSVESARDLTIQEQMARKFPGPESFKKIENSQISEMRAIQAKISVILGRNYNGTGVFR